MNLTSYLANKCFAYLLKFDTNQENINSRPDIQQKSIHSSPPNPLFPLPWSTPPKHFRKLCDGCGICAKACDNNIIIKDKAGYPMVDLSRGSCSFCGACAQKCPQDALQYDPVKPPWYLRAAITAACLMNNKVLCNTCIEHCDKKAISSQKTLHANQAPRVLPEKCDGCGACFRSCPVGAVIIEYPKPSQP